MPGLTRRSREALAPVAIGIGVQACHGRAVWSTGLNLWGGFHKESCRQLGRVTRPNLGLALSFY